MDELIKANPLGQWEILEKAKFITPEQQKANKLRAQQESNTRAMTESKIKTKPKASTGKYSFDHEASHPDMEEYSVRHGDKHLGYATVGHNNGEVGGSIDWDEHPDVANDVALHHGSVKKLAPKDEPVGYKQARSLKLIKARANGQWEV